MRSPRAATAVLTMAAALPVSALEPCVRDVIAENDPLDGGEVRATESSSR